MRRLTTCPHGRPAGSFIMGIFFTMFISWIKFPGKVGAGGLVPPTVFASPKFTTTAGALDFNWGNDTGALVGAFFLFLYLDFIGSSITFMSLGQVGRWGEGMVMEGRPCA